MMQTALVKSHNMQRVVLRVQPGFTLIGNRAVSLVTQKSSMHSALREFEEITKGFDLVKKLN
jgi:hypothetical protein